MCMWKNVGNFYLIIFLTANFSTFSFFIFRNEINKHVRSLLDEMLVHALAKKMHAFYTVYGCEKLLFF